MKILECDKLYIYIVSDLIHKTLTTKSIIKLLYWI